MTAIQHVFKRGSVYWWRRSLPIGTGRCDWVRLELSLNTKERELASRQHQHLPQTQDWLMRSIACMLAGRTAELLILGEAVAGAGGYDDSDLARATEHAVAAETRLGFSAHQPLLYRSAAVSINELTLDRHLADRVNARLSEAEAMARGLLENRRDALVAIATRLKEVGAITGEEVNALLMVHGGPPT